jgi:hypothetical protein
MPVGATPPGAAPPIAVAPPVERPVVYTAPPSGLAPRADAVELAPLEESVAAVITTTTTVSDMRIIRLNDPLSIDLTPGGLDRLRARARAKSQDFGLYFGGFFLKGVRPRIDPDRPDRLLFIPEYTDVDKPAWNEIFVERDRLREGVSITLGFPDGEMLRSPFHAALAILPPSQVALSAGLAIFLLLVLVYVATRTPMLRDTTGVPPGTDFRLCSYSLGRTQMAWWTVLVLWTFCFLYHFTGTVQLTSSVVVLMGIGAATALGGTLIDSSKIAALAAAQAAAGAAAKPPLFQPNSEGFLRDLISDDNGPSLHRLQIFAWTIILSAVFLHTVLTKLGMPDFDNTMLALMGVSSGTYLGFKIPEKPPGRE